MAVYANYHIIVGRRAGSPEEWAHFHWDTYGFELLGTRESASGKLGIVVCVPTGDPEKFERELRADHVEFFKVPAVEKVAAA